METYLLVGFLLSVVGSLATVLVAGMIIRKLPADDLDGLSARQLLRHRRPFLRRTVLFLKNVLGAMIVVVGVILSVPGIPGPGILTILIGLMLLDFREKPQLERRLIRRPTILRAVNDLRRRYGRPPLTPARPSRKIGPLYGSKREFRTRCKEPYSGPRRAERAKQILPTSQGLVPTNNGI
jgi:hypothetical protein